MDEESNKSQKLENQEINIENKDETNETKKINIVGKSKKKVNKQIILVLVLILICAVITAGAIVLKIHEINNNYSNNTSIDNIFTEEKKKEDDDKKYIIDYGETYDFNDIAYKYVYKVDGNIYNYNEIPREYREYYQYIEISGLIDKSIENKINSEIKDRTFSLNDVNGDGRIYTSCRVIGNFSNVLSILISNGQKYKTLNFDLNTGEQIPFEKIFIKSAPVVSIIADAEYKNIAWNINIDIDYDSDPEGYFQAYLNMLNMENRDTSQYEDILLKAANQYNLKKDNIVYAISPYKLYIYDFNMEEAGRYNTLEIDLYKYKDYVAIYKRYIGKNLYEDNTLKMAGIKTFYEPMSIMSDFKDGYTIYGDLTVNSFFDICYNNVSDLYSYNYDIDKQVMDLSLVNLKNFVEEKKKEYINNSNNGYVLQGNVSYNRRDERYYDYNTNRYIRPHIEANLWCNEATMSRDNFKNLDFYLAYASARARASVDPTAVAYLSYEFPEIKQETIRKTWYFDLDCNYLGDSEDVVYEDVYSGPYNPS